LDCDEVRDETQLLLPSRPERKAVPLWERGRQEF
jgi:hypothetical protein